MASRLFSPKIGNRIGITLLFIADVATVTLLFFLSAFIRRSIVPLVFSGAPEFFYSTAVYYWVFPVWIFVLVYEGAYTKRFTLWDEVKFIWKCTFIVTLTILAILFVGKQSESFSRSLILLMSLLSIVLFPPIRTAAKKAIYRAGLMKRKILIIGAGEAGASALLALEREPDLGYEVAGFVDDAPGCPAAVKGIKVHRRIDGVERYIRKAGIHDILIAKPEMDRNALVGIINALQHKAENILYIPDLAGIAVLGTELRHFFHNEALVIEIRNNLAKPLNYALKRAFDYGVGVLLFGLLLLPIMAISFLIRLTSRGPAIFRQERIGKNLAPFRCYKFRTMYCDAEQRLKDILARDPAAREEWDQFRKLTNDPRITALGRLLRMTSLDELPQLFNILKGEMSLVGPRPVTGEEIALHYRDAAELCFSVPPGITGLWQVSGRSNSSYEQRISLDTWYVRNWNLWLDIVILLRTVNAVVRKEGAR